MSSPLRPHWQGNQRSEHWPPLAGPPAGRRKRWPWLLLVVAAAAAVAVPLVLVGGDDQQQPQPGTVTERGDSSTPAGVPEQPEKTPRPKDRDPDAVAAALRQLDPCKLLDLGVAKKRGRPDAVTIRKGSSECQLVSSPDYDPAFDPGLKLRVGVDSDQITRYSTTPLTLAGSKAYEQASSDTEKFSSCSVLIPVSFVRAIELSYMLLDKAELCPIVRQYAAGTVAKLRNPDAVAVADHEGDVEPQRPLLYGADENDTGAVGDCVDLPVSGGLKDCEPYHEVRVPPKPDDIMAAPSINQNVQCAVFEDAVQNVFGKDFSPVTWGEHCFFVDPTHVIDIRVNVDAGNRPSDYGRGRLYSDREETEVAGLPAVTFWNERKSEFDIYLSPNDNLDQAGNLHIALNAHGGRGTLASSLDATVTQEQITQATEVMTQVVDAYFR